MKTTCTIHSNYRTLLDVAGLCSFDDFFNFSDGAVVDRNSKRCVFRIAISDKAHGGERIFYLKLFRKPSFNNYLSALIHYMKPKTEARIEWDNAQQLIAEGFNTIPLAAFGEQTILGFEQRSFFLSEEISDSVAMDIWMESHPAKTQVDRVLHQLAILSAGMHDKGFSYPDLYIKHVFVNTKKIVNGQAWLSFIDLHRLRRKKTLSADERVVDLTAFMFSASPYVSAEQSELFLSTYLKDKQDAQYIRSAIGARLKKLAARRTHTRGVIRRSVDSDSGTLTFNELYYDLFNSYGLTEYAALYDHPTDGLNITDNPGRHVDTFSLIDANAKTRTFYIKKHTMHKNKLFSSAGKKIYASAKSEWRNHLLCERFGINVPEPVVWGVSSDMRSSILITAEIENAVSVESLIGTGFFSDNLSRKDTFIREIANMARSLHRNRYFHKDFYTGHIFVQSCEKESRSFYLLDLQRVNQHKFRYTRWSVKDLAQLNFTALNKEFSLKDRIKFLHYYLRTNKLDPAGRKLFYNIDKKTQRIRKHIPNVMRRKNIHSWYHIQQ